MSRREFAQLKLSIWTDPDFTELTPDAQLIYITALSHPTVNLAGVLDYVPAKFARLSKGMTAKRVQAAVSELERTRFIVSDDDTGELLVRSAIRSSGAWKKPTTAKSIVNSVAHTFSPALRQVLASELRRAVESDPGAPDTTAGKVLLTCANDVDAGEDLHKTSYTDPYIDPSTGTERERDRERDRELMLTPDGASEPIRPKKNFPDWWAAWGKKKAKGDAEKAYDSAVPKKISHDDLMAKTRTYWEHVKRTGVELTYVPYPASWLRAEQWDDDLTADTPQQQGAVFDPTKWRL